MSSVIRKIFTTALIIFIGVMLQTLTNRLVYYPMPYPQGNWDVQKGAGAQDRWFQAADGTRLHAWWFSKPEVRLATLFLHGNAGNVTHRIDHAHQVLQAGSAFLVLDYRGYGKSQGHPSEGGLYQDADAAYADLLTLGYKPDQIILQGESLGTAVAVDLATRRPCAGLILESPLKSLRSMAATVLPFVGPLLAHGFDTDSKISRVRVPILILHGTADEVVPFSQGQAVFQKAREPKQFWSVSGAHHNDLLPVAGSEYIMRLRAFYQTVFN